MNSDLPCRKDLVEVYKYLTGQEQAGPQSKLAGHKLLDGGKGIHAGLWLDKYIGKQTKDDTTSRRALVEQVSLIPISASYRQFYKRWEEVIQREYGARARYGTVKGRMVVGLGDEGVLETSVTLHHTYGVPYIPGSALKGLAAHYANLRAPQGSGWKKGEELYNVVFGRMEGEGNVIFFDAFYIPPDKAPERGPLHPDIITVHHRDYYQDQQKAPADWDSPTPIPFLSATGTYLLALAAPELPQSEQWIDGVFAILGLALEEIGIGAKTSSGYGRMRVSTDNPEESALDPKVRKCIQDIGNLPKEVVNQKSYDYYKQWKEDFSAPEDRLIIARELIKRIKETGYEAAKAKKSWYQELVACVQTNNERA